MHVAKYTSTQCGQLLTHYNRNHGEDRNYSNTNIDKEKTHLNYNLAPDRGDMTEKEFMDNRLEEVKHLNRADVIHLADWVVTLPQDFKGDSRDFFQATYDTLAQRYGEQNVVSAYVHMDEKTPHMHFAFMPIVVTHDREGHTIEKLSAKEVLTREELREIHPIMEKQLSRSLDRDVHLLNGATAEGNRSIKELQRETAVRSLEKIADLERVKDKMVEPAEPKKSLTRGEYVPYSQHCEIVEKLHSNLFHEEQRQHQKSREYMEKEWKLSERAEYWEKQARAEHAYRLELQDKLSDKDYLREHIKELEREERESRNREDHSHSDHNNRDDYER